MVAGAALVVTPAVRQVGEDVKEQTERGARERRHENERTGLAVKQ